MSATDEQRLITTELQADDEALERAIRPQRLDDYIGQTAVKRQMRIIPSE